MTIKTTEPTAPAEPEEPEIEVDPIGAEPDVPLVDAIPIQAAPPPQSQPFGKSPAPVQGTTTTTTTTTVVQQVPQQNQQQSEGLPPGGRWAKSKEIGPTTWTICALVSIATCICVACPCGLWAFLCPCDEERVYVAPDGRVFDRSGKMLGYSRHMNLTG